MRHKKEWTPFARKVSNRQRPVRFRSEKCDFQNETINNLFVEQDKLHSKTGKSTYFYKQRWFSYSIPFASTLALLLVMGCMINPVSSGSGGGEKVYAAGEVVSPDPDDSTDTTTDTTNMSVSLTMANPDQTLLQQNAKAGEMSYISSGFTVKTENVDGYNVYVQTAPGSTNKLTNGNISIDFVTTETPVSNFTDNTWGYAVDDTGTTAENLKYSPVPDTASIMNPAYTSSSTGETRNFTLNFATKFAKDATPGHYTSGVLLSVAAGAEEVTELPTWTIKNMQDMNSTICQNAEEGTTGQLTDLRDGKTYWVTKLKDSKCWMTQNLALDLDTAKPLTSELSDVNDDYVPSANTQHGVISVGSNNAFSYNPGKYVYAAPMNQNSCSSTSKLEDCPGWILMDGLSSDTKGNKQAHYLAGNYYSYRVATAGYTSNSSAPNSICPKGWTLPTGGIIGQYATLVSGLTASVTDTTNNIKLSPYYFVYGGYVNGKSLVRVGNYGYYWSSTDQNNGMHAYVSYFSNDSVSPSGGLGRDYGAPVRCVAR